MKLLYINEGCDSMTIGDRIKKLREESKMTQEELAKYINSTKQTIYKYENNIITNIPSDKIESIAKALKVSPSYLMGWEEKEKTEIYTLAAHHDGNEWTEEELEDIENFKKYVLSKRKNNK